MKNIFNKNVLFGIIIGIFITSGISVLAINYIYNSEQVSYIKNDSTETDIKTALDELYDKATNIKGEVLYTDAAWPGTLTYTATRDCDGTIILISSNWNAPELTINLKKNNTVIFTTNSRTPYQVPVTIKKDDVFKYEVASGSPNYSHMSMTVVCLN